MAVDPNPLAHFWWWFEIHTGTTGKPPAYYGFWSGFGSDIGEIALIGGVVAACRHVNCNERGCWRIGHKVEGQPIRACHRHHPEHPRKKRNGSINEMHRQ